MEKHQDLHVILVTQLAGHWAKDTGAAGVLIVLDQDGGVVVKPDVGAVDAADALGGTDDNGLDHLALLYGAAGSSLADRVISFRIRMTL